MTWGEGDWDLFKVERLKGRAQTGRVSEIYRTEMTNNQCWRYSDLSAGPPESLHHLDCIWPCFRGLRAGTLGKPSSQEKQRMLGHPNARGNDLFQVPARWQ